MGPAQLAEVLRQLPNSTNPNLLVGFETSDDAGVFRLSETQALVQTLDFFTPIVDDPYAYGSIAAANSLSDVYAMGGMPLTVLNIACFNPDAAPAEVWAEVFRGMHEKTVEAGAAVLGGHTVNDDEPKFGMSVTGIVDPNKMFANGNARAGDGIYLSKPLGTGIVSTAAKYDQCPPETLRHAIETMATLNRDAAFAGLAAGVRCATDITGYSLAGHLFNVARASKVTIEIEVDALPLFEALEALIDAGMTTGGGGRNRDFLGENISYAPGIDSWMKEITVDPQTSGGLALFSTKPIPGLPRIGTVTAGSPHVSFV